METVGDLQVRRTSKGCIIVLPKVEDVFFDYDMDKGQEMDSVDVAHVSEAILLLEDGKRGAKVCEGYVLMHGLWYYVDFCVQEMMYPLKVAFNRNVFA